MTPLIEGTQNRQIRRNRKYYRCSGGMWEEVGSSSTMGTVSIGDDEKVLETQL